MHNQYAGICVQRYTEVMSHIYVFCVSKKYSAICLYFVYIYIVLSYLHICITNMQVYVYKDTQKHLPIYMYFVYPKSSWPYICILCIYV